MSSGLGRLLRRLDQLLIPRKSRGPGGVDGAAPGPPKGAPRRAPAVEAVGPADSAARADPPTPSRDGRLRRLDQRYARVGLLGFLHDVPQVAFVAVAALLVVGALAVLLVRGPGTGGGAANPPGQGAQAAPPTGSGGGTGVPGVANSVVRGCPLPAADGGIAYVGPPAHEDIARFLVDQRKLLDACARSAGGQRLFAVVSLAAPQTPDGVARFVGRGPVGVLAGYALLPGDPLPRILPLGAGRTPLTASAMVIRGAFAAAAASLAGDAKAQEQQAATITAPDPGQQAFKADFLKSAATDRAAQAGLAQGCGCVYGLLVEAKISALRTLDGASGVRLVELAPPGTALDGITPRPLLVSERDQTGTGAPPTPIPGG